MTAVDARVALPPYKLEAQASELPGSLPPYKLEAQASELPGSLPPYKLEAQASELPGSLPPYKLEAQASELPGSLPPYKLEAQASELLGFTRLRFELVTRDGCRAFRGPTEGNQHKTAQHQKPCRRVGHSPGGPGQPCDEGRVLGRGEAAFEGGD